jgi:homoserine kinase
MKFKSKFKLTAPATIANIACGFDVLGLALQDLQDEIIVNPTDKSGIHISSIINNKTKIPLDIKSNAAGFSAQLVLDFLKKENGLDKEAGLDLKLIKKIPVGYGLGSSTASAAIGAAAVNEAFGLPLTNRELIPFAAQGELVAEGNFRINSIVPCLLGGFYLTRDHKNFDFHRLPFIKGLKVVVIYPEKTRLLHKDVRKNIIIKSISLAETTQQSADIGSLVQSLYTTNLDLLARSLEDHIAEKHWSHLIPFFKEVKETALKNKALGCSIAGTGSGIFALCKNNLEAEQVAKSMQEVFSKNKLKSKVIISNIAQEGVSLS